MENLFNYASYIPSVFTVDVLRASLDIAFVSSMLWFSEVSLLKGDVSGRILYVVVDSASPLDGWIELWIGRKEVLFLDERLFENIWNVALILVESMHKKKVFKNEL